MVKESDKLRRNLKIYNDSKKKYLLNEKRLPAENRYLALENFYDLLLGSFDSSYYAPVPLDTELWITNENKNFMLKKTEGLLREKSIKNNDKLFKKVYKLWEKVLALTARRSFHHFLIYMELDRTPARRVYHKKRDVILRAFAYYFEEMMYNPHFTYLSDSKPPSAGKTFCVNYGSAFVYGINKDSSILRISVAEDNVVTASSNIKRIIEDDRFKDVFPYFRDLEKEFEVEKTIAWRITGADVEVSHMAVPMGGQIEGKRANAMIIVDDSLKQADASNDTLMEENWQKYLTSISARGDSELVKHVMIGTMWHPNDLLGQKIAYESKDSHIVDGKFKYTKELWRDGNLIGVIIQTPMLDYDTDETTCEHIMSTASARKLREETDEFLWSSAYQQKPIPPKGRLFEYDSLKQYTDYDGRTLFHNGQQYELSEYARMSIDPVRKGLDKISCPIFRTDEEGKYEFLVDTIFRGKAMDEVYGDIINKIVLHNINFIVLENNTDTSLKELLLMKLKEYNRANHTNYIVEIVEKYNTTRKKTRISEESHVINTRMVFPKRGTFPLNSDMGGFMQNVTSYSDLLPNKNDDAPDSLALYSNEVIREKLRKVATATAMSINALYK